jgi:hypothetical protein
MKKFTQKFLKSKLLKPKGHWMVGLVWPVEGSKGKQYNVELHDKGFTCDCTGFSFHGKCKHSVGVLQRVEEAIEGRVPEYHWD